MIEDNVRVPRTADVSVKMLIERLKKCDPDALVHVYGGLGTVVSPPVLIEENGLGYKNITIVGKNQMRYIIDDLFRDAHYRTVE
jgi:hypothetical protein